MVWDGMRANKGWEIVSKSLVDFVRVIVSGIHVRSTPNEDLSEFPK